MKYDLNTLEKVIHYSFKDKELMQTALTHKTFAFEADTAIEYNERLEFLGDSVLNFIIAKKLYHTNQHFTEGELTRRRALLVNNTLLAKKAKKLKIGNYLRLGKGEKNQNGKTNPKNLANALEALIGAIYIDSNLETVQTFILDTLLNEL